MFEAIANNDVEAVRKLLDEGVSPNYAANGPFNNTKLRTYAVHFAAKLGRLEICRLLIERGADPNRLSATGESALTTALLALEVVKRDKGQVSVERMKRVIAFFIPLSDLKITYRNGRNVLHYAAWTGDQDVVDSFWGIDDLDVLLNQEDQNHNSPLDAFREYGCAPPRPGISRGRN